MIRDSQKVGIRVGMKRLAENMDFVVRQWIITQFIKTRSNQFETRSFHFLSMDLTCSNSWSWRNEWVSDCQTGINYLSKKYKEFLVRCCVQKGVLFWTKTWFDAIVLNGCIFVFFVKEQEIPYMLFNQITRGTKCRIHSCSVYYVGSFAWHW